MLTILQAPFLKLYTTYCTNYDQAIQTLVKAKKEPNFATFLETCLKTTTHTLESLLITVVQRVPRYILLLQVIIIKADLLIKFNPNVHYRILLSIPGQNM